MRNDDALGMLVLGGGVAAASALALRSMRHAPTNVTSRMQPDTLNATVGNAPWRYPVPSLGDRHAVTSSGFRAIASSSGPQHLGADLMFRRRDARDLISVYPPGSPNGSLLFFMPDDVPALSASAGIVTFAASTAVGNTVIVQHSNGWATYYTHLATLVVKKGQAVTAGQVLGTIGASPIDSERLKHLHVELWKGGKRAGAVDPDPFLAAWSRTTLDSWSPRPVLAVAAAPRNGTMSAYRPLGERGDRYPEWVQRLRGASGVYVIREIDGPIVYVGSSVRRLYATLTRHFQTWRRFKGYWRGQFAEGADPGQTYERNRVEVAIKLTTPDDAHEEELRTIRRLQPRDNQLGQPEPELEDAPF